MKSLKRIASFSLVAAALVYPGITTLPVSAAVTFNTSVCPAGLTPVVVYAQDVGGIINDSALINDRDGNRLVTVGQRRDNYVNWPATYLVAVRSGEQLIYQGGQNTHRLAFDILDVNHQVLHTFIHYTTSGAFASETIPLTQDGFIKFPAGDLAHEYNILILCKQPAVHLIVSPQNRAPICPPLPPQQVPAGQQLQFSVSALDPDGDSLIYSAFNLPPGATFHPRQRLFTWLPLNSQVGGHTATIRASDGIGICDIPIFITVTGAVSIPPPVIVLPPVINQPPVWLPIPAQTVYTNQTIQFSFQAIDPENDPLTYSALSVPGGANFNPFTRLFSWTPAFGQTGTYNLTLRVSDPLHQTDMNVPITVLIYPNPYPYPTPCSFSPCPYPSPYSVYAPQPHSPSYPVYPSTPAYPSPNCSALPTFVTAIPPQQAREGQVYTYTVQANTSPGCPLTYRLASGPPGLTVDRSFGVILWVPNFTQGRPEPYPVTIGAAASYYGQGEVAQTFYITVDNADQVVVVPPPYPPSPYLPPPFPPPPPPPVVEKLKISNVRLQQQLNGDIWVYWETNRPTTARVIYDTVSHADQTRNFTYANATPEDTELTTGHGMNLGNLEVNRTYYLRAVSKTNGEVATSHELSFIKLPCLTCLIPGTGAPAGPDVTGSPGYVSGGLANLLTSLGDIISNPWFLLLVIITLVVILIRVYRQQTRTQISRPAAGPF